MKYFLTYNRMLLAVASILLFGMQAHAATISGELFEATASPGSDMLLEIRIDTEDESLNAFGGTLRFPADLVEIKEIRDGGSIITAWLEQPREGEWGTVSFSGITPGGYRGSGTLFSVVFTAQEEGTGLFSWEDLAVFLSDGTGKPATVSGVATSFSVSAKAKDGQLELSEDTVAPEEFTAVIAQSDDAFEGKPFLVFATQDKGSGIARYEVCVGLFAACIASSSPYVLDTSDRFIRVIAYDVAGNAQSTHVYTGSSMIGYATYLLFGILCVAGLVYAIARPRIFK